MYPRRSIFVTRFHCSLILSNFIAFIDLSGQFIINCCNSFIMHQDVISYLCYKRMYIWKNVYSYDLCWQISYQKCPVDFLHLVFFVKKKKLVQVRWLVAPKRKCELYRKALVNSQITYSESDSNRWAEMSQWELKNFHASHGYKSQGERNVIGWNLYPMGKKLPSGQ